MKRLLLTALFLFCVSDLRSQSVGGGIGFYSYTTNWYLYNSSAPAGLRERWPIHVFDRTQVMAYYETSSLLALGPIQTSLRLEFLYGLGGGTKGDWITTDQISEGGTTLSGAAGIKLFFPVPLPTFGLSPYVMPMFHYSLLNSNGQGVSSSYSGLGYDNQWDEHLFAFAIGIGAELRFVSVIVAPEYRFFVAGGVDTDVSLPGAISDTGPTFGAFVVTVGLSL
jgi:hypothetical protein